MRKQETHNTSSLNSLVLKTLGNNYTTWKRSTLKTWKENYIPWKTSDNSNVRGAIVFFILS